MARMGDDDRGAFTQFHRCLFLEDLVDRLGDDGDILYIHTRFGFIDQEQIRTLRIELQDFGSFQFTARKTDVELSLHKCIHI